MRRIIISFATALTGMLVLVGCEKNIFGNDSDEAGIILTVKTSDSEVAVKGPVAGDDNYNENKLTSFYYFFFTKDVTDQPAVVQGSASGFNTTGERSEKIPVSTNDLNSVLFSGDRECSLFIIANPTDSMKDLLKGTPTLAELRTATVVSSMDGKQDSFVMVHDDYVTIDSRVDSKAIEVTVELKRLACKFSFNADVISEITTTDGANTITWTPITDSGALTVQINNAINKTTPAGFNEDVVEDSDYFNTTPVELKFNGDANDKTETKEGKNYIYKTFSAEVPVYSYPMKWVFTDEHEPYLLFDLLWNYDDGTAQRPEHRYYKLMLGQQSITANDWYVITAKLTGIGSLLPRDPVADYDNLNYLVNDWNNAFDPTKDDPNTPANIKDARYLMVPKTSFEIQNEESFSIPFTSSHNCSITNITVKKNIYFNSGVIWSSAKDALPIVNKLVDNGNVNDAEAKGFIFTLGTDKIEFKHELHNEIDGNMDISPYTIEFTLKQDDSTVSQKITLIQYPAIWVELERNSSLDVIGYTYYNGNCSDSGSGKWNRVRGISTTTSSSSTNPYMTIFHISQFDASEDYVIGDPRTTEIVETSTFWTDDIKNDIDPAPAPARYDNRTPNRTLEYYYPTIETSDHANFIAPVLRATSAYCRQSESWSYGQAKLACASYQEDGYPAGRWRIPTKAEARFIKLMSFYELVNPVFTGSTPYWYAGGYMSDNTFTDIDISTSKQKSNPRCVYDEWYWSKIDKDLGYDPANVTYGVDWPAVTIGGNTSYSKSGKGFVWGDMPRNYVK